MGLFLRFAPSLLKNVISGTSPKMTSTALLAPMYSGRRTSMRFMFGGYRTQGVILLCRLNKFRIEPYMEDGVHLKIVKLLLITQGLDRPSTSCIVCLHSNFSPFDFLISTPFHANIFGTATGWIHRFGWRTYCGQLSYSNVRAQLDGGARHVRSPVKWFSG